MLNQISISNFAIVDHLNLDINAGMTAITGETGAGKSIMLDALGLALGGRADSNCVRDGAGPGRHPRLLRSTAHPRRQSLATSTGL